MSAASALRQPWCSIACRHSTSTTTTTVSSAVNSMILRSLKDHYLEVSKMTPPPVNTPLSLSHSLRWGFTSRVYLIYELAIPNPLSLKPSALLINCLILWQRQKVSPPTPFTILTGALDGNGPVLKRSYGDNEEISISVMRLANIVSGGDHDDDDDDTINQLFLHVHVLKPKQKDSLHFLCGLYPDALGIHSVSMRPKADSSSFLVVPAQYTGPVFE